MSGSIEDTPEYNAEAIDGVDTIVIWWRKVKGNWENGEI